MKRLFAVMLTGAVLVGCATASEINAVIEEIDTIWKEKNDKIKQEIGTVIVEATVDESFDAMLNTFMTLGFTIKEQSRRYGSIRGVGPAPLPLTEAEWQEVKKLDEPEAKAIIARTMPISSLFSGLHTDEVEVHFLARVESAGSETSVSVDYTIVDHKMLNLGLRAGENPGPETARKALLKAWAEFDRQLDLVRKK